jgi:hypothetical protein
MYCSSLQRAVPGLGSNRGFATPLPQATQPIFEGLQACLWTMMGKMDMMGAAGAGADRV